jgi:hypothetical protein
MLSLTLDCKLTPFSPVYDSQDDRLKKQTFQLREEMRFGSKPIQTVGFFNHVETSK